MKPHPPKSPKSPISRTALSPRQQEPETETPQQPTTHTPSSSEFDPLLVSAIPSSL